MRTRLATIPIALCLLGCNFSSDEGAPNRPGLSPGPDIPSSGDSPGSGGFAMGSGGTSGDPPPTGAGGSPNSPGEGGNTGLPSTGGTDGFAGAGLGGEGPIR